RLVSVRTAQHALRELTHLGLVQGSLETKRPPPIEYKNYGEPCPARGRRHGYQTLAAWIGGGPRAAGHRLSDSYSLHRRRTVMKVQEQLLAAIRANPDDDAVRLVYADWLEEHGDPDRAEFIRVQITLDGLPPDDPRYLPLRRRERQ